MGGSGSAEPSKGCKTKTETENEGIKPGEVAAVTIGAIAVGAAALFAWGAHALFSGSDSGSSPSRKTMKAPGRGHRIFRDDFEKNPAGYFRDLHKK